MKIFRALGLSVCLRLPDEEMATVEPRFMFKAMYPAYAAFRATPDIPVVEGTIQSHFKSHGAGQSCHASAAR
jgi:hypothetical protein